MKYTIQARYIFSVWFSHIKRSLLHKGVNANQKGTEGAHHLQRAVTRSFKESGAHQNLMYSSFASSPLGLMKFRLIVSAFRSKIPPHAFYTKLLHCVHCIKTLTSIAHCSNDKILFQIPLYIIRLNNHRLLLCHSVSPPQGRSLLLASVTDTSLFTTVPVQGQNINPLCVSSLCLTVLPCSASSLSGWGSVIELSVALF